MNAHVQEGQSFLLPLGKGSGQFAVGVVARVPRRGGVVLGYFFGPRRREPPGREWLNSLKASQAVFAGRFKDAQLYRGEWRTLTVLDGFDRRHWPVPAFHRFDGSATQVPGVQAVQDWRVEYGDENLITPFAERPATPEDLKLGDDVVLDWTLLADEVGKRVGEMIPTTDDSSWR